MSVRRATVQGNLKACRTAPPGRYRRAPGIRLRMAGPSPREQAGPAVILNRKGSIVRRASPSETPAVLTIRLAFAGRGWANTPRAAPRAGATLAPAPKGHPRGGRSHERKGSRGGRPRRSLKEDRTRTVRAPARVSGRRRGSRSPGQRARVRQSTGGLLSPLMKSDKILPA